MGTKMGTTATTVRAIAHSTLQLQNLDLDEVYQTKFIEVITEEYGDKYLDEPINRIDAQDFDDKHSTIIRHQEKNPQFDAEIHSKFISFLKLFGVRVYFGKESEFESRLAV